MSEKSCFHAQGKAAATSLGSDEIPATIAAMCDTRLLVLPADGNGKDIPSSQHMVDVSGASYQGVCALSGVIRNKAFECFQVIFSFRVCCEWIEPCSQGSALPTVHHLGRSVVVPMPQQRVNARSGRINLEQVTGSGFCQRMASTCLDGMSETPSCMGVSESCLPHRIDAVPSCVACFVRTPPELVRHNLLSDSAYRSTGLPLV